MTRVVPVNSEAVLEDTGVSQGMCLPAQGSLYIALRGGKRGEEVAAGRFEETVGLPHDTAHRNITEGGKKESQVHRSLMHHQETVIILGGGWRALHREGWTHQAYG
eukprot:GGOE01029736.1.p3 GENE.GGOE01029736.1~~GGOE01029736.1.p3  ORF type:complete len:106 (+),score=1.85 GGOE01029736.1:990-1307(+)